MPEPSVDDYVNAVQVNDPVCKDAAKIIMQLYKADEISVNQMADMVAMLIKLDHCDDHVKKAVFTAGLAKMNEEYFNS